MKALYCLLAVVMIGTLGASPVGNPAFPRLIREGFFIPCDSIVNFRLGYEGDFVSDALLKQYTEGGGRVDCFGQNTNSGTITVNFKERLDIYSVLGSSQFSADWRFELLEDQSLSVHRAQMETLSQLLWGIGGRAIVFQTETLSLGIGGRYSRSEAEPVWLTIDGINKGVEGSECKWNEWQVDLDFAFQIDLFTPYFGAKYSIVRTRLGPFPVSIAGNRAETNHFKSRVPAGVFLGCSISNGKYFMLNIEARLVDEEAVTISGDLRF